MRFRDYLKEGSGDLHGFRLEIEKKKAWILKQKDMAKKPFNGYTANKKLLDWVGQQFIDFNFGAHNIYDGIDFINQVLKTDF